MPTTKLALNAVELNYDWFDPNKATSSNLPEEIQVFSVEEIKNAGFRLSPVPRYRKVKQKKNGKDVIDKVTKQPVYVDSDKLTLLIQSATDTDRPPLRVGFSKPLMDSGMINEGEKLNPDTIAVMLIPKGYENQNGDAYEHDTFLICRPGGNTDGWF